MSKKFIAYSLTMLVTVGYIGYAESEKKNIKFPYPKVDIEVFKQSYILPKINYDIDAKTGEVETILEKRPDEYMTTISVHIDKKRRIIDNILNRPKLESLELYVTGKQESCASIVSGGNRTECNSIPLNQDYDIIARAVYSNDESRIVLTGVNQNAIDEYKVNK